MEMRGTSTILFLATHISNAEAMNPSNPVYCYVLDVFLLLYSIIFTALYLREKFQNKESVSQDPSEATAPTRNPNEPVYTDLDLPQMDSDYHQLRPIRRREEETQYQELRGQSNDEYQRINTARNKPRKAKNKSNEPRTGRRRDAPEAVEMYTLSQ